MSYETIHTTEAGVVADLASMVTKVVDVDGREVLVEGTKVVDLDDYRTAPLRAAGNTNVTTIASLFDLIAWQGGAQVVIAATSPELGRAGAVATLNPTSVDRPGWADHTITYTPVRHPVAVEWGNRSGAWISQAQFRDALLDGLAAGTISSPDAATVREWAAGIEIQSSGGTSVASDRRTSSATRDQRVEHSARNGRPDRVYVRCPLFVERPTIDLIFEVDFNGEGQYKFRCVNYDRVLVDELNDQLTAIRDAAGPDMLVVV